MSRRGHQRGAGLIDALIAIVILAFGMLAMTGLQARVVAQGTESQNRLIATQIADQLLAMAVVDPSHAACYTHNPTASTCPSADPARTATSNWAAAETARLPGFMSATSALDSGRLTVTLRWAGKAVQGGQTPDTHQIVMTSDVRP